MKSHKTAVVIIPDESIWGPIQSIRRKHDRQYRRWMPHITLIYPFRPATEFSSVAEIMKPGCSSIEPFGVELRSFRMFVHPSGRCTLWLAPHPTGQVTGLQSAIAKAVPDCDDVSRFKGGFTPRLSVGQAPSRRAGELLREELNRDWRPLAFTVDRVSFISRGDPPGDVFRRALDIDLGESA